MSYSIVLLRIMFLDIFKNRRQLRGHPKILVANNLIDSKTHAILYIRTKAKNLINFGDLYPLILPKASTLRKTVSEIKTKRLGLSGLKPIDNLIDVKDSTHVGSIHKIGASLFFCYYWTKQQQLLYKLHHKNDKQSLMTIDATGSLIKKN